jgi:hypothetical protein
VIAVEPTVPNWMWPPDTVPLMGTVDGGVDSFIVPDSLAVACDQVRTKVPLKEPLYLPFQVPERPAARTVARDDVVVVAAGVTGALLLEACELVRAAPAGAELEPSDVALPDEHAAANMATVPIAATRVVRDMSMPPQILAKLANDTGEERWNAEKDTDAQSYEHHIVDARE